MLNQKFAAGVCSRCATFVAPLPIALPWIGSSVFSPVLSGARRAHLRLRMAAAPRSGSGPQPVAGLRLAVEPETSDQLRASAPLFPTEEWSVLSGSMPR